MEKKIGKINIECLCAEINNGKDVYKIEQRGLDGLKHMYGKIKSISQIDNNTFTMSVDASSHLNNYRDEIVNIYISKTNSDYEKLEKIEEFHAYPENNSCVKFTIKTNKHREYNILF